MDFHRFARARRLAVLVVLALAAGSALGSVVAAYAALQDRASRELALRQGPPPPVAVEAFRPLLHRGPAGEIALRAEADPAAGFLFTLPGTERQAWLVPLSGADGDGVVHGAIFIPLPSDGLPSPDAHVTRLPDGGLEVNGVPAEAGPFLFMLAGALAAEGRTLGPRFVAVTPFLEGREAALRPVETSSPAWLRFALAAVALAALAGVLHLRGARPARPSRSGGAARTAAPASGLFPPLRSDEDSLPESPAARAAETAMAGLRQVVAMGLALWRRVGTVVAGFRNPR